MELTPDGRGLLGDAQGVFKVRYNNGPVFKPGDKPELPAYIPLAFFRSEVAENGTPAGVMVNSPAQVRQRPRLHLQPAPGKHTRPRTSHPARRPLGRR